MTTRTWMTMLLASLITAGWAHQAGAQPAQASQEASEDTHRKVEYYGWQIIAADAASVVGGIGIGSQKGVAGAVVFASGYVLGGSLVHLGHGRPGRALGSIALRTGLPALGIGLVILRYEKCYADSECEGFGSDGAAIAAGMLGMAAASVLDWTVLGTSIEEVPVESGTTLVPQVRAGADGSLQVGVQGRF